MKKCKLLQLIMQRKILKTNFIAMDLYTCCHFRNRPAFCSYTFAKTCPFSCQAKRAFPSGETLILLISRDSRYNTLHFASKVVCQRGHPFGNPGQQNRRYAALSGSIPPFVVSSPFHGLRVVPCKLT